MDQSCVLKAGQFGDAEAVSLYNDPEQLSAGGQAACGQLNVRMACMGLQ